MTTTKAMLDHSELVARENDAATHKRTQYVIKIREGFYACAGFKWTNVLDHALRFDFMTSANAHGFLVLGLSCDDFTVDPV